MVRSGSEKRVDVEVGLAQYCAERALADVLAMVWDCKRSLDASVHPNLMAARAVTIELAPQRLQLAGYVAISKSAKPSH
jgi:hypothetical protein